MKLLICGDSFSFDHGVEHSWPYQLAQQHQIKNLSQCGCGEYKIRMQLINENLSEYDAVLIFHTSPNRVYYPGPNTMHKDQFHDHCDLLFADVEQHRHTNKIASAAYDYFVNIFDMDYHCYIHNLICADIDNMTKPYRTYHFTAFDYAKLYKFDNRLVDLYNVWQANPGTVNHLNPNGHMKFFKEIVQQIKS